jgi:hypothetical protein
MQWRWKGSGWEEDPKQNKPGILPRKGGEVGVCKDLERNVFTIGSGNKGKDGDMLRTSKEELVLYIGTNYGDDACQGWLSDWCCRSPPTLMQY